MLQNFDDFALALDHSSVELRQTCTKRLIST